MNRYSNKRRGMVRQLATHNEEDSRESEFLETKILMDFIVDLQAILKETRDAAMQTQLTAAKNDLRQRINKLTRDGYALPQLYSKFGANILKAQIIDANNTIQQANREGEYRVADLLDEDTVLQRLAPDRVDQRREMTDALQYAGFNAGSLPSDLLEKLKRMTGSENIDELRERIAGAAEMTQRRATEVDELREQQQEERAMMQENRQIVDTAAIAQKQLGSVLRAAKQKKIADDTVAAAQVELPDETESEEEKIEVPVVPKPILALAADPAPKRSRPRAQTVQIDLSPIEEEEKKSEKKVQPSQEELDELESRIQSISTGTSTLKDSIKSMNDAARKKIISAAIVGAGIQGMKMTQSGKQVSFQAAHRDRNILALKKSLAASQKKEDRARIQEILDVYQQ